MWASRQQSSFNIKSLLIFFFLIFPCLSFADEVKSNEVKSKPEYFDYYKGDYGFRFKEDLKHVAWDSRESTQILLWGGLTAGFLGTTFKNDIVNEIQDDLVAGDYLGNTSKYGDEMGRLFLNYVYVGYQYVAEKVFDQPYGYQRSALMMKASIYAGVSVLVLKNIVRERRPNGGDSLSFPSGHTTTAFAYASVVAAEHEWYWGVTAYSLATFVGASRMNDNAHYLHDVIAGATLGSAFGVGLSQLYGTEKNHYYRPTQDESASDIQTMFLPTDDGAKIIIGGTF